MFDSGRKVHENRKKGNKVLFMASELGSRRFCGCLKQVMAWIKLEQFREALDLCTAPQPRKRILWGGGHWSLVAGPTFGDAFDWRMSLGLVLLGDGFRSLCRWLALTLSVCFRDLKRINVGILSCLNAVWKGPSIASRGLTWKQDFAWLC